MGFALLGAMNILVIDDSVTIRHMVKRMLEESFPGSTVHEAGEGRSAIRALTQQKIDLIITDLEMPGMDGNRFLETLRGNPLLRKKAVVVLSSSITADLELKLQGVSNVVLLQKPARREALREAAERCMRAGAVNADAG
jgi:two-component system chemotaxis response regulator CheY